MNTHNLVCDFGKHKGELYTRIPVSYLLWMVNADHSRKEIAEAELERRGTTLPDIDISGHAIDRMTQKCYRQMKEEKAYEEGLHSWMVKTAREALEKGKKVNDTKFIYKSIQWVYELSGCWPVLRTVMPEKKKKHKDSELNDYEVDFDDFCD
jgi:hypothetical protein